jgi:hypothetical protein
VPIFTELADNKSPPLSLFLSWQRFYISPTSAPPPPHSSSAQTLPKEPLKGWFHEMDKLLFEGLLKLTCTFVF